MTTESKYKVLKPLSKIENHTNLPAGTVELARIEDKSVSIGKTYCFLKHESHLTLLKSFRAGPKKAYYCAQFDFPLKTLSWFPKALEDFQKPPAEGGLHAGAMVSPDEEVDGEILAIGRTTDGYDLTNRSRNRHDAYGYEPMRLSLSSEFFYDLGFLALWKSLGDKYENGLL